MKTDSLESMVKDYERRTGEEVSFDGFYFEKNQLRNYYHEYFNFFPHEGFMFWGIFKDGKEEYFVVLQTYGNMKVIGRFIANVMEKNNLRKIVTATARKNVNGFIKKWTMKRIPWFDYEYRNKHYKALETTIDNLLKTL